MASKVERKCKIWTSNLTSKDLEWTMANKTMSKTIDDISATIKDQGKFGQATSLEEKEASDEVQRWRSTLWSHMLPVMWGRRHNVAADSCFVSQG